MENFETLPLLSVLCNVPGTFAGMHVQRKIGTQYPFVQSVEKSHLPLNMDSYTIFSIRTDVKYSYFRNPTDQKLPVASEDQKLSC